MRHTNDDARQRRCAIIVSHTESSIEWASVDEGVAVVDIVGAMGDVCTTAVWVLSCGVRMMGNCVLAC